MPEEEVEQQEANDAPSVICSGISIINEPSSSCLECSGGNYSHLNSPPNNKAVPAEHNHLLLLLMMMFVLVILLVTSGVVRRRALYRQED